MGERRLIGGRAKAAMLTNRDGDGPKKRLYPITQINIRDGDGHTPLSFAAKSGLDAVVKLLIKEDGVQIHKRDRYGRTPL
jgi:ankyrin repeat protein